MATGYKGEKMRRVFLITHLLFVFFCCFAQQNIPGKIIGKIPDRNSVKLFQIQVGAYKLDRNTENALLLLQKNALNPVSERYLDFTRVMIRGIPANQVVNFLAVIRQAGFNEVIIREDSQATISEKWEINSPGSAYSSFEFNHDRHYIAVESDEEKPIRFGEYSMHQRDTINLDKLGTVTIRSNDNTGVNFSFTSIDEPERVTNYNASKAEAISRAPKLDLLCRTWKVVNCTESDRIGLFVIISNVGTYFSSTPDGYSSSLSKWRWHDEVMESFEYSHDNWGHYGRASILDLTINSLRIHDAGYSELIPGYSTGYLDNYWELVPVNKGD